MAACSAASASPRAAFSVPSSRTAGSELSAITRPRHASLPSCPASPAAIDPSNAARAPDWSTHAVAWDVAAAATCARSQARVAGAGGAPPRGRGGWGRRRARRAQRGGGGGGGGSPVAGGGGGRAPRAPGRRAPQGGRLLVGRGGGVGHISGGRGTGRARRDEGRH